MTSPVELASSDISNIVDWNTTVDSSGSIIYHEIERSAPEYMTEKNNMAEDAVIYHVTHSVCSTTHLPQAKELIQLQPDTSRT